MKRQRFHWPTAAAGAVAGLARGGAGGEIFKETVKLLFFHLVLAITEGVFDVVIVAVVGVRIAHDIGSSTKNNAPGGPGAIDGGGNKGASRPPGKSGPLSRSGVGFAVKRPGRGEDPAVPAPRTLYHFTCADHGYPGIARSREIRPYPHLKLPTWPPVVWLTDLARPSRDAVGLTSARLTCDRLAVRLTVEAPEAVPFAEARRRWRIPLDAFLDLTAYGDPAHWYVSQEPIVGSQIVAEAR